MLRFRGPGGRPCPAASGARTRQGRKSLKILVTGAAGMIGRKLCERLAREGKLGGKPITSLHMVDVVEPKAPQARFAMKTGAADISQEAAVRALVGDKPDVIFHLAAIVSGEAEGE